MESIAVIGVGHWGPNLVRNFATLAEVGRVLACDRDPARLEALRSRHPDVEVVPDVEQILARGDVPALAVATPAGTHEALARAALGAGKHVLVEKPLALSARGARQLDELARARGRVLMVDHTDLFGGGVERLLRLARDDELGPVHTLEGERVSAGPPRPEVDVIWDLAPHDLGIAGQLFGRPPSTVSAAVEDRAPDGRITRAELRLTYDGGAGARFRVAWERGRRSRRLAVRGARRTALWDAKWGSCLRLATAGDPAAEGERVPVVNGVEPLGKVARHFLECCAGGPEPLTGGEAAVDVVRALEACARSAGSEGREIPLG